MGLKFRPELLEPAAPGGWYVSDGDQSVGPVALELLVRGVESGRVPTDAFIRHEAWKVWRPLHELTTVMPDEPAPADLTDDEGPATIRESSPVAAGMPMAPGVRDILAAAAATVAEGGFPAPLDLVATFDALAAAHGIELLAPDDGAERSPPSHPPPNSSRPQQPPTGAAGSRPLGSSTTGSRPIGARPISSGLRARPGSGSSLLFTDDIASAARPAESADRLDGDELAGATDLREALLLFLGAVVRRLDADGALLHRVDDVGAVVACAHGRAAADALGSRTRLTDPSFIAASSGHPIIAEPEPGPGGSVLRTRLEAVCGAPVAPGAAGMFPVVAGGRLRAFIEIGRIRPMTMRDWAEAERLVRSLVARIHAADW